MHTGTYERGDQHRDTYSVPRRVDLGRWARDVTWGLRRRVGGFGPSAGPGERRNDDAR